MKTLYIDQEVHLYEKDSKTNSLVIESPKRGAVRANRINNFLNYYPGTIHQGDIPVFSFPKVMTSQVMKIIGIEIKG